MNSFRDTLVSVCCKDRYRMQKHSDGGGHYPVCLACLQTCNLHAREAAPDGEPLRPADLDEHEPQ